MKSKLTYIKKLFILCCTICLGALPAYSQGVTTASISGTIVTQDKNPVEGASIVAIHIPSGTQYSSLSRAKGYYNIPNMKVGGPYKVTVTTTNSESDSKTGISLTLGEDQDVSFNIQTNVTDLEEVVVSSTTSTILNAKRTGAASTLSNKTINDIATSSRSFTDLTKLDPRANGLSFAGRNPLYNNITVDGSYFNNAFGLQATIGSQASASPISLDAIEQIQVALAPYDVRQGMSTGANINAVTRSGDNEFRGSVYGFLQSSGLVGERVGQFVSPIAKFDQNQFGARFGGAIVKNKLFFFVSYEQEYRTAPPSPSFVAGAAGVTGTNVSAAQRDTLQALSDFLKTKYGYDPGLFENYNLERFNRKINARIDWNISKKHTLNVKFNYLQSYSDVMPSSSGSYNNTDGRQQTKTGLPFQGSLYRINNNLYSGIAELNSKFSNKVNNSLSVGYTAMRDFRESPFNPSGKILPTVDIANGSGAQYTVFGYEPFSYENKLNSNILQIQDNVTFYTGAHTFTAGVAAEFNSFENGFAPNYQGQYRFKSLTDFYNSAKNGVSNAETYQLRYSLLKDTSEFPIAKMAGNTYSVYVQDEWNVLRNLRITLGVRVDMFHFPDAATYNPVASNLVFNDGMKYSTAAFPGFTPIVSPRIGFNYDVLKNKKLQIRGGVGLFTGRIPFVWLSNQASNNGALFGSFSQSSPSNRPFTPNIDAYRPAGRGGDTATSYNLVFTDPNFKFPQVFRANLAVDLNLGKGWVVTAEGIYTKDINAVYFTNIAMANPAGTLSEIDQRPIWYGIAKVDMPEDKNRKLPEAKAGTRTTRINEDRLFNSNTKASPTITNAILMQNTNLGYSLVLTAQIQKQFSNGLSVNASYTYTDAKSVNDGGSIAESMWRDRAVSGNPNTNVLANTRFLQPHRVTAFAAYEFSYLKVLKTTLSLYYSVAATSTFSYTYAGDVNGDRQTNDLIYIPKSSSDINLVDIVDDNKVVTYTKEQQWQDLNTYINNDEYLSTRRGQYAERNGAFTPPTHQMDFRLIEEIKLGKEKSTHRIQVSLDIFNFLNLLNPNWGIVPNTNREGLITFKGFNATTGNAEYTYPYLNSTTKEALTQAFSDNTAVGSRWAIQLGVRYIFN